MADNPCGIKRWVAVWKDTWGTGCLRQGSIPCLYKGVKMYYK